MCDVFDQLGPQFRSASAVNAINGLFLHHIAERVGRLSAVEDDVCEPEAVPNLACDLITLWLTFAEVPIDDHQIVIVKHLLMPGELLQSRGVGLLIELKAEAMPN